MRRVIVHIEQLVLKGFRPGDRRALAEALQRELSVVLGDAGVVERVAALGELPRLRVETRPLAEGVGVGRVGAEAARAICKGLAK